MAPRVPRTAIPVALLAVVGLATVLTGSEASHDRRGPTSLRAPARASVDRLISPGLGVRLRAPRGTRVVVLSLRRSGRTLAAKRFSVRRGGVLRLRWRVGRRPAARLRTGRHRLLARTRSSAGRPDPRTAQRLIHITRGGEAAPDPTASAPSPTPAPTPSATPTPGPGASPTPAPGSPTPLVVAAAGDIACAGVCGQDETANLVTETIKPHAVLGLGDYQYETGTTENFYRYYHPYWGRFRDRTYAINGGSHDFYGTGDYLTYFNDGGPRRLEPEASYSFDLGGWHFIALNSYCFERSSCDEAAWTEWLRRDLEAHPTGCAVAYFHQPYWTTPSRHNRRTTVAPWVRLLHQHGVEILLQAHVHAYERFAPQNADDQRDDAGGIVAFTVGTGGKSHDTYGSTPAANSLVRNGDTFGVLELVLRADGYDFRFVPEPGRAFTDSGSGSCH